MIRDGEEGVLILLLSFLLRLYFVILDLVVIVIEEGTKVYEGSKRAACVQVYCPWLEPDCCLQPLRSPRKLQ